MLFSDILLKEAAETDNLELYKFASEIRFTENDKDIEKDAAGPLISALYGAAKGALGNSVVRSAAGTAAVGAGIGAIRAEKGEGFSGAIKGGLFGAALGGGAGLASKVTAAKIANPAATMGQTIATQGRDIASRSSLGFQRGATVATNAAAEKAAKTALPITPKPNLVIPPPAAKVATLPTTVTTPPPAAKVVPSPDGIPSYQPGLATPGKGTNNLVGKVTKLKEAKFPLPKPGPPPNAKPFNDITPINRPQSIGGR